MSGWDQGGVFASDPLDAAQRQAALSDDQSRLAIIKDFFDFIREFRDDENTFIYRYSLPPSLPPCPFCRVPATSCAPLPSLRAACRVPALAVMRSVACFPCLAGPHLPHCVLILLFLSPCFPMAVTS
jgi:hypothetical protein